MSGFDGRSHPADVGQVRRRLRETEEMLRNIDQLESQTDGSSTESEAAVSDVSEFTGQHLSDKFGNHHSVVCTKKTDLYRFEAAGRSTPPEFAEMNFTRKHLCCSTPKKHTFTDGYLHYKPEADLYGKNCSGNCSKLQRRIFLLSKDRCELFEHNQHLVSVMEQLMSDLNSRRKTIESLLAENEYLLKTKEVQQEKIASLVAETETHDIELRNSEERFEQAQQRANETGLNVDDLQKELDQILIELCEEKNQNKELKKCRDETVCKLNEVQKTMVENEKKWKDRMKKMETREASLQEMLTQVNRERTDLLEKISDGKEEMHKMREEMKYLCTKKEELDDNKSELEMKNRNIKSRFALMGEKVVEMEKRSECMFDWQRENIQLREQVKLLNQQLHGYVSELEEINSVFKMFKQLIHESDGSFYHITGGETEKFIDDSGNISLRPDSSSWPDCWEDGLPVQVDFMQGTYNKPGVAASLMSVENNYRSLLGDLKMKMSMKETVIHNLKSQIQLLDSSQIKSQLESLRAELRVMTERDEISERRSRDLDYQNKQLFSECNHLKEEIQKLKCELAERDGKNNKLESQINERNAQVVDLQEELNVECTQICTLEKELRKKVSQISMIERELDEKSSELAGHVMSTQQLEHDTSILKMEVERLKACLCEKDAEKGEEMAKLHKDQCEQLQGEIDIFQDKLEKKIEEYEELKIQIVDLTQELNYKSACIQGLEGQLSHSKMELATKTKQTEEVLLQLKYQASEGTSQVKQLETSIHNCKKEIQVYLRALEDSKHQFDVNMAARDEKISQLEDQIKVINQHLESAKEENSNLNCALQERQDMLQQSADRIGELEEAQQKMSKDTFRLEHQLLQEHSENLDKTQMLKQRMHHALQSAEQTSAEVVLLKEAVSKLKDENTKLKHVLSMTEQHLQKQMDDGEKKCKKTSELQEKVFDLETELEQRNHLVGDYEEQLLMKEEDLQKQLDIVNEGDQNLKSLQGDIQLYKEEIDKLENTIQNLQYSEAAKEHLLEDQRDAMRKMELELSTKKRNFEEMQDALDTQHMELDQKAIKVQALGKSLVDYQSEMEKRVKRLELVLKKSEDEIKERSKQIADLDNKHTQTLAKLNERTHELQGAEQRCCCLDKALATKTVELDNLQMILDKQNERESELKETKTEVTQELRLTREQLQKLHADYVKMREKLKVSHQEQDKLAERLENITKLSQKKESNALKLAAELNECQAANVHKETQLTAEFKQLQEEMRVLKKTHQMEVQQFLETQDRLKREKVGLSDELQQKMVEINQEETQHKWELEKARNVVMDLKKRLHSQQQIEISLKDSINLKDAAVNRLQARLSSHERSLLNMKLWELSNRNRLLCGQGADSRGENKNQNNNSVPPRHSISNEIVNCPLRDGFSTGDQQEVSRATTQQQKNDEIPVRDVIIHHKSVSQNDDDFSIETFQDMLKEVWNLANATSNQAVDDLKTDDPLPQKRDHCFRESSDNICIETSLAAGKTKYDSHLEELAGVPHEYEPLTAVEMYGETNSPISQGLLTGETNEMDDHNYLQQLQERIRTNEQLQSEIDQRLQTLQVAEERQHKSGSF